MGPLRGLSTANPVKNRRTPRDLPIIVYCHSGVRSAAVVNYLSSLDDFKGAVSNLEGGIDRWSVEVDQNIQDIKENLFCLYFH